MDPAFRYRMATRMARRLRAEGGLFPFPPWARPWA
jgi:hypothetical protein